MIEVNNLVLYGKNGTIRLKIPELKFHSPGITALVGHNGAGKSSLLKLAAGLEKSSHGSILYDQKDIFIHQLHQQQFFSRVLHTRLELYMYEYIRLWPKS